MKFNETVIAIVKLLIQTQKRHRSCPSRRSAAGWCRTGSHCCGGPYWPFLEFPAWCEKQQSSRLKMDICFPLRSGITYLRNVHAICWYLQKLDRRWTLLHHLSSLEKYLSNRWIPHKDTNMCMYDLVGNRAVPPPWTQPLGTTRWNTESL